MAPQVNGREVSSYWLIPLTTSVVLSLSGGTSLGAVVLLATAFVFVCIHDVRLL